MKEVPIMKLYEQAREVAVELCKRSSSVCDASCRRKALREQALTQAWRHGARV